MRMDEAQQGEPKFAANLVQEGGGRLRLVLRGRLDMQSTAGCWHELESRLRPVKTTTLTVDVRQLELRGGIGIALLRFLSEGGMTPGAAVTLEGLNDGARKLMETFTAEDYRAYKPHAPRHASVPEEVGGTVRGLLKDLRDQVEFLGAVLRTLPRAVARPKLMRWREVRRVFESAGANALPVVGLFSCLVGLITALEAANPLKQFGAQIFIADMIGFSSIRDTGPLVTAIMLAGRSGSAFAAELGTMKVNQELDALETMGLPPIRFLVVPRILAALLLTPVLTLYSMTLAILGGVTVMRFMGFPPLMIFHEIITRVHISDLVVGLTKSLIFGLIIGAVGCLRGLQTKQGPEAVGVSTTRAVVACIILIIVADTIYSGANYFLSR